MPRKKANTASSALPEDLQQLVDDDSQTDLRDPEQFEQEKISLVEAAKLSHAFRLVANSAEGIHVFRHILWLTGFHAPLVTFSAQTGEVNAAASNYNVSKRDVWLEIRKHLPAELLRAIENPLEVTHE